MTLRVGLQKQILLSVRHRSKSLLWRGIGVLFYRESDGEGDAAPT